MTETWSDRCGAVRSVDEAAGKALSGAFEKIPA
jgi:hypothetical protein